MTRSTLYIYNRECECIFIQDVQSGADKETARPATGSVHSDENAKLVFGIVFSLASAARKLTGRPDGTFHQFSTSAYRLHYLRSPTSYHFVLVTTSPLANMQGLLRQIHTGPFADFVVRNPLSRVGVPGNSGAPNAIENDAFRSACGRLLEAI